MGKRDALTLDLFELPKAPLPIGGSLNYALELRHVLSDALKKSPKSRYEIAARMSELTGEQITKETLDAWTAESKKQWRFPFEYAAAFEAACEIDSNPLQELLGRKRGTRILVGKESLYAELGHIAQLRAELNEKEKQLKRDLGAKKK
jgi:hypothetical protein